MILVLLLGCYTTFLESHCELEVREIADTERLDEVATTIERVLGPLGDPVDVDAVDLSGAVAPLTSSVVRRDGPALLDDATIVTEEVSGSGRNTSHTWVGEDAEETCRDLFEVPVTLSIVGEGVSIVGDALLTNDPNEAPVGVIVVTRALDFATDTLPAGQHGAPVSGEVRVSYVDSGSLYQVEAIVVAEDGARETVLWYSAF